MDELLIITLSTILGALSGFFVSFIIAWYTENHLYRKKTKEERERYIIEQKFTKLYSPLYMRIKASEIFFNKDGILALNKGEWENVLKPIIDNGFHLASKELQPLLAEWYLKSYLGDADKSNKLLKLITEEYEKLSEQYLKI